MIATSTKPRDYEAERRTDDRANVTGWLDDAIANVGSLLVSLERVVRDASGAEPLVALAVMPHIEAAVAMRDKLRQVKGAR